MIEILKAQSEKDFKKIEELALIIVPETYRDKSPPQLTKYFLDNHQTAAAIANQIASQNYHYFLLSYHQEIVGYLAVINRKELLYLSKLYLLKSFRGLGIGKASLDFVDAWAEQNKYDKIELTVNRKNAQAIKAYERNGYSIAREVINDFGSAYTVEDYEMEKIVS